MRLRASRPWQTVESDAGLQGFPEPQRGIVHACTRAPRQQHMQDEGLGMNSVRFGASGCEIETSFTRGSLWNCVAFFEMFCIVLDLVRKGGVFEMFCIRLSQEKGGQDRHAQEG